MSIALGFFAGSMVNEQAIQAGDDNQPVAVGEFPDFATWLEPYSGEA
jgi:hypothetical protein